MIWGIFEKEAGNGMRCLKMRTRSSIIFGTELRKRNFFTKVQVKKVNGKKREIESLLLSFMCQSFISHYKLLDDLFYKAFIPPPHPLQPQTHSQ